MHEIDRLKSEFVAAASHELRTPLTTLLMGIGLLQEQMSGTATEREREILAMCREDGARLDRLVGDLLDLSKIESGRMTPALAAVPAAALVRDAVESSRLRVERKGLGLRLELDSALPDVMVDRSQIERVVSNLMANAVAATPAGGRITVSARRLDDRIAVSIADTGRGIPSEYLPRLFSPFVQVPGAATGSAGLGLAISQRIIEAHGGQIAALSEIGRGATFTFTLPVAGAAVPPSQSPETSPS